MTILPKKKKGEQESDSDSDSSSEPAQSPRPHVGASGHGGSPPPSEDTAYHHSPDGIYHRWGRWWNIRDTFVWTITIGNQAVDYFSLLSLPLDPLFLHFLFPPSPPLPSPPPPAPLLSPFSSLPFSPLSLSSLSSCPSSPLNALFLPSSPLLFSPLLLLSLFLRRYDLSSSSGDSSPEHPSISKRPSYRPPSAAAPSTRGKKPLDTSPYYSGYNSSEEYDGSRRPYLDLEVRVCMYTFVRMRLWGRRREGLI